MSRSKRKGSGGGSGVYKEIDDEEWVILPVSAVDAYYGNNNFSKKWKQQLPKSTLESKEACGICKLKMAL